jgi:hypothetical protein
MIKCAVHHTDIDLCGCDADQQYRKAQSAGTNPGELKPADWVLAPREPTEAMIKAGYSRSDNGEASMYECIYRAMIAAAPPPAPSGERGELIGRLTAKATALSATAKLYRAEAADISGGEGSIKFHPEARNYVAKAEALEREIVLLTEAAEALALSVQPEPGVGEAITYLQAQLDDFDRENADDIDAEDFNIGQDEYIEIPTAHLRSILSALSNPLGGERGATR